MLDDVFFTERQHTGKYPERMYPEEAPDISPESVAPSQFCGLSPNASAVPTDDG